jgi:hypothetical protein
MSDEKEKSLLTPIGRVSFPTLFKPRAYKPGQQEFFSVNLFWPATEAAKLAELVAKADAVAREKWGAKLPADFSFGKPATIPSWLKPDHLPFSRDDDGNIVVRLKSKSRPGVVGVRKDPTTGELEKLTEESGRVYGGCYGRCSVTCYAYDNESRGVKFGLVNFQKTGDGEPLGGRTDPDEDFDAIEGADDLSEADALFA